MQLTRYQRIRGQRCKHILYALVIILKAPAHLRYQHAFLSSEIASIFAAAPITSLPHNHEENEAKQPGRRKPIEGECPICVFDMEPAEDVVWCKTSCGQNFHRECFEQWKRSKMGGRVTCVYCRAEWDENAEAPEENTSQGAAAPMDIGNDLRALKDIAPKIGSYKNVKHLMPQYQEGYNVE